MKVIHYLLTKLAAAGFLMFIISIWFFLFSGLDMFKFVEGISNWFLWGIIFGYSILCSLLIDLILFKVPHSSNWLRVFLYVVAGYAFFLFSTGTNVYTIIAGTVGAICALIFYFSTFIFSRFDFTKYVFSIVIPLALLILMTIDFTEKEQWVEERNDQSYTASFTYFNGKHEIPIQLEAGEVITLSHTFYNENGGGHGFRVLDEKNKLVGLTPLNEEEMVLEARDAGVYKVVVTGDDVKGSFQVKWE